MAKFVFFSDRKEFVNIDSIQRVFIREEEIDEEANKAYYEETGLFAPIMHEIIYVIGGEEYLLQRLNLEVFDKASEMMGITEEDVATIYIAALIYYDFQLSVKQFLWIALNEKSKIDELIVGTEIYKVMSKAYEEAHGFYDNTFELKNVMGYTSKRKSDLCYNHYSPKTIMNDKIETIER